MPDGAARVTPPYPKSVQLARGRRPAKPRRDPDASLNFKVTVCAEPCLIHGTECAGPLQAAHVVSQQALKRRGLHHLLWDPANGVSLCTRTHTRHDLGAEKISRDLLPARCVAWAAEHGLSTVLERHWPLKEEA